MKSKKEQEVAMKEDFLADLLADIFASTIEELMENAEKEKESHANKITEAEAEPKPVSANEEEDFGKRIKSFFDRMVEEGKATATVEDGHPHYSIKMDEGYEEPKSAETLVEEGSGTSFSMSKEELAEFVRDYTKLENTFRKLEHAFGIDMNASADSIYVQYNELVWTLIGKIFGEDNRDDIADYCFGNSNFDTVEDLYEELV